MHQKTKGRLQTIKDRIKTPAPISNFISNLQFTAAGEAAGLISHIRFTVDVRYTFKKGGLKIAGPFVKVASLYTFPHPSL